MDPPGVTEQAFTTSARPQLLLEEQRRQLETAVTSMKALKKPLTTGFKPDQLPELGYNVLPELLPEQSGTVWSWGKIQVAHLYAGIDPVPAMKESTTKQWSDTVDTAEAELFCHKEETVNYANKKHTAGIFVGCCLHGVMYGFHMMVAPEGRKDLHKVLYERMPQEVLDQMHVVYDFSCQAAEYMLNREPDMFAKIRLFVDRFHAMSHKCADVFKMQAQQK